MSIMHPRQADALTLWTLLQHWMAPVLQLEPPAGAEGAGGGAAVVLGGGAPPGMAAARIARESTK